MIKYGSLRILDRKYDSFKWNDRHLCAITNIFHEGYKYPLKIKEELLTLDSKGLGGNYVDIEIRGDLAFIGDQRTDPDDFGTVLTKHQLINLIDQWYEITKDKPDIIYLYQDGERYWFDTKSPEEVENKKGS